jgi:hypothetical protein
MHTCLSDAQERLNMRQTSGVTNVVELCDFFSEFPLFSESATSLAHRHLARVRALIVAKQKQRLGFTRRDLWVLAILEGPGGF